MAWRTDADERLAALTGDAGHVARLAETAAVMGAWPDGHVMRVRGADGRAAWVRRGTTWEGLACPAVAPWDSVWSVDYVDDVTFYALHAPPDWVTKARAGVTKKDWQSKHVANWQGVDWAVGLLRVEGKPRSRAAVLYRVAEVQEGRLAAVYPADEAPAVPVELIGATRWIPQDAHPAGYAAMWERGDTESGSYMWHVIKARHAAGLSARTGHAKRATR